MPLRDRDAEDGTPNWGITTKPGPPGPAGPRRLRGRKRRKRREKVDREWTERTGRMMRDGETEKRGGRTKEQKKWVREEEEGRN